MSHQVTSSLITTIGSEYDKEVHQWKAAAVSELESTSEADVIYIFTIKNIKTQKYL